MPEEITTQDPTHESNETITPETPEEKKLEEKEVEKKTIEANNDDEEIPVRKTPKDYILERKLKKLEKLKEEKIRKADEELKTLAPDLYEDNEDLDDLEDEDERKVAKTIKKLYGESLDKLSTQELETEITSFVSENPDFKPFKEKISKWAKHPSYSNLPIAQIAYAVAGPKLLEIGAMKAREAEEKMDSEVLGGGITRRSIPSEDPMKMSKAEFETYLAKIKGEA